MPLVWFLPIESSRLNDHSPKTISLASRVQPQIHIVIAEATGHRHAREVTRRREGV